MKAEPLTDAAGAEPTKKTAVRLAAIPSITIVAVTSLSPKSHAEAIKRTAACLPYACDKLLISPVPVKHFDGQWLSIPDWMPNGKWELSDLNRFLLFGLNEYIQTDIAILVQWDGYGINKDKWTDAFLSYDYIGAPWPATFTKGQLRGRVGNGGFSLRSKRWLEAAAALPKPDGQFQEDIYQCLTHLSHFEKRGCVIAPLNVAVQWSLENTVEEYQHWTIADSFGFHGLTKLDPKRRLLRLVQDEHLQIPSPRTDKRFGLRQPAPKA